MPFIACLNNVKTTHAAHTRTGRETRPKNTRPTPQSRNEPVSFPDTTCKETSSTGKHNYTYSQQPPPPTNAGDELVAKMLASTMQISNNNPTNTLDHPQATSSKGRNRKPNHTPPQDREDHARGGERAADPSGPNSVLDPTPTNAGPG